MNGRTLFKKYGKVIDFLVSTASVFPRSVRQSRFEHLRMKNGKIAMLKRYVLLRTLCKKCGTNVSVFPSCFFLNLENLEIGSNVSIHEMCYLDAEGGISIGDEVSIAHRTTVLSSNHGYERNDIPIKYQEMKLKQTSIQDNVWIGCGCSIMAGTTVKSGCVIGAGSVVTHDTAANSIVVGVPAKKIKDRIKG